MRYAAEAEGGSDDWGGSALADAATLFTWVVVGLAVLIGLILLLNWYGRRRVVERDAADDPW